MEKHIEQDTTSQLNNEKIAQMSEKIGQMTTAQIAEQMVKMEILLNYYEEHFRLAQHKRFGASSEKTDVDSVDQMNLFNEAEVTADPSLPEPEIEEILYKRRKRRGKEDRLPPDVPVEIIEHDLTEAEKICPQCGETMRPIGEETRDELVIIPATVKIRRHVKKVYACRNCQKNDISTPVLKAKAPKPVISGGFASPEAVAYIMCQKFVLGVPLFRQETEWKRNRVLLSRQTMSNWLIKCAEDWLWPIYNALHLRLLALCVAHADETPLQVLREPGKSAQSKSYMWLYRTSGDAKMAIVLFEYQPNRKKEHPRAFLSGFKGFLHTDGYAAYHDLPDEITVVGCLAHSRRKFDEALKIIPKEAREGTNAWIGLQYCNQLFALEREFAGLSHEERFKKRQEFSRPLMKKFHAWLLNLAAAEQSLLGKARHYALSQWQYLKNYLLDGRLEISNNRAERSNKMFVIDRKNFLFSVSQAGARSSAIIFSIIQTALENNLKPFEYLTYIFQNAPSLDLQNPDDLAKLMPDSPEIPDCARMTVCTPKSGEQSRAWDEN
jgi:transposase